MRRRLLSGTQVGEVEDRAGGRDAELSGGVGRDREIGPNAARPPRDAPLEQGGARQDETEKDPDPPDEPLGSALVHRRLAIEKGWSGAAEGETAPLSLRCEALTGSAPPT